MKPAAGTRLFFIGDDGVLFSEPRQELHAFNTTACVVWCHLEDGLSPAEIAGAIRESSGLDPATAHAHVEAALTDWTAKGLLEGGPIVPIAAPPADPVPDLPPLDASEFRHRRNYRMLGVAVEIRFGDERDAVRVDPLLAHLRQARAETPGIVLDIARVREGVGFYLNGAPADFCPREDQVAPYAKANVWTAVLRRQDYLMQIHAGVVGGEAGCVLLPAAPGSGKSTLTTALVHAGFDLFSDEVALLGADLTISPFPTAICVKDSGIDIIASMYPSVRALPLHLRGDGKRVVYLPPPSGSLPPDGHRRPVRGIAFPRYVAGAPMTSRCIAPAAALARLLSHCQNVARPLDQATVGALVRWIATVPCVEVCYGSLEPVLGMVGRMSRGADAKVPRIS